LCRPTFFRAKKQQNSQCKSNGSSTTELASLKAIANFISFGGQKDKLVIGQPTKAGFFDLNFPLQLPKFVREVRMQDFSTFKRAFQQFMRGTIKYHAHQDRNITQKMHALSECVFDRTDNLRGEGES